jgi:NTE family protein
MNADGRPDEGADPASMAEAADSAPASVPAPPAPGSDGEHSADLVLEGGGVKGIGLVGAVCALAEAGYSFPRVAGTSAGAITAALIAALQAAAQPLAKLKEYVEAVDYSNFEQESWLRRHAGRAGEAEHLLTHMGLFSGDYLVEWLGDVLRNIGITTFGQLKVPDPKSSLPWACQYSLVVHTSDITRGKVVRLPWDYPNYGLNPDTVRIVDAVRASMSIPFFFDPVRLQASAASYDGVDYQAGTVTWVDGGLLSNFPVEVFDRTDGEPSRWPTIGIKLSARAAVVPPGQKCNDTFNEALGCLHAVLANADRYYLTPDKVSRTIFVDSSGITATDFGLTVEQRRTLYNNGLQAATAWLADKP